MSDNRNREHVMRPSSRALPFSLGGAESRSAGALLPEGPNPLYDVELHAPDLAGLPWERRARDAWTTSAFRALVLAWLADMVASHSWIYRWHVRERATQARLSSARLTEPLLIFTLQRRDGRKFELAIAWTAHERDDDVLVQIKLELARLVFESLHAQNP